MVDASGRGALTSALLDTLGWERPQVTEVGVDISYATAVVPIPTNAPPDWKLLKVLPNPPALGLDAVLVPLEGGRWIISIADRNATARPETWDSFLEASHSLNSPTLYNALRYAKPLDGTRRMWTTLEYWPSPRPVMDGPGRLAHSYGSEGSRSDSWSRLGCSCKVIASAVRPAAR